MAERMHALLVYNQKGPLAELRPLLDRQNIRTTRVRNCAEAAAVLALKTPDLIFTDTALADGIWAEVEALAERRLPPVPVIVVSGQVDVPLYLDALERGASDFIVPPFRDADLDHVVKGVLLNKARMLSAPLRAGQESCQR